MATNSSYVLNERSDNNLNDEKYNGNTKTNENDKIYSFSEAMEITGNGCYNYGLLATLSLTILAMSVDMFSFSTIVSLSSCEFQLSISQTSVLLAMPFLGPVTMSYVWGYISDTQGRRKSLLIAMSGSFVMSVLCAFSPNWIVLAILKCIGTCFCCCANSATFTLLSESCSDKWKDPYLIAMGSVFNQGMGVYFTVGYFIMDLEFSFDLGFVTFLPWRLLALVLALPIVLSIISLSFCFESPKYLLNAGCEKEALNILTQIYRINGGKLECFPVQKIRLTEMGNERKKCNTFLQSLKEQTVPLFKPPFLKHTVLLNILILLMYSAVTSTFTWMPFIAGAFTASVSSGVQNKVFCEVIEQSRNTTSSGVGCEKIELPIVIFGLLSAVAFTVLCVLMAKVASRRKTMLICLHLLSATSCLCTLYVKNSYVNLLAVFGIILDTISAGILFSYCVDFFPTSYRGMATCLNVVVARVGSLLGADVFGPLFLTQCTGVFYVFTSLFLCNALGSLLLPPDNPKSVTT